MQSHESARLPTLVRSTELSHKSQHIDESPIIITIDQVQLIPAMRPGKSALLSVVAFVGLVLVAKAAPSSNDSDQSGQNDSPPDTSLKNNDYNATIDSLEATYLTPGHSRTGLGGQNINGTLVPRWMSILVCPKVRNRLDGHLCGIMTWISKYTVLASNDAMFLVRNQLSDKWDGPPAGWRREPKVEFNIDEDVSSDEGNSDWRYRFKHRTTLDHGLGIWFEEGNREDLVPYPRETTKNFVSPYDAYDIKHKPKDGHCYVMLFGSDMTESPNVPRNRRLRHIYVDLESCDGGECSFKASSTSADVPEEKTGQFCGEYSDVGAPIVCKTKIITHIVTKVMGDGKCSDKLKALQIKDYKADLVRVLQVTERDFKSGLG